MRALTRLPGPKLAHAELTHLARQPIDLALALKQHAAYRAALEGLGLSVEVMPALEGFPDAPFVEDVALSFPELNVVCRPGAASRSGEVDAFVAHLGIDRPLHRLTAPATLDGGDVLRVGREVFVGLSTRTTAAAVEQLASALARHGYRVHRVRVPGALHLKTAVTALPDGRLVMNRAWVEAGAFEGFTVVDVDPREPFAANCLHAGGAVLHAFPATATRLERAGFEVRLLELSEFGKAEAGLTCLSVVVPPRAG